MQGGVDQVLGTRIEAEERGVQLMRDPGERMPIRGISRSERPNEIGPAQARRDVGIVDHILVIVVIDEGVVTYCAIEQESDRRQKQRCYRVPMARRSNRDIHRRFVLSLTGLLLELVDHRPKPGDDRNELPPSQP